MDATSTIAIVGIITGVVGTLAGSIIGTIGGYQGAMKSAMKSAKLQIDHQEEKDKETSKENEIYIEQMILAFIKYEIELNYNILTISGSKNIPIENVFELKFIEYERAKYKLLEKPTQIVKDVNKLYLLFSDILLLRKNLADKERTKKLNEIIEQKKIVDKYFINN